MSSCKTFLLKRLRAFSSVSPSWSLTSAKLHRQHYLGFRSGCGTVRSQSIVVLSSYPSLHVSGFQYLAAMWQSDDQRSCSTVQSIMAILMVRVSSCVGMRWEASSSNRRTSIVRIPPTCFKQVPPARADSIGYHCGNMLELDDPRWAELRHAYGFASDIPGLLRQLGRRRSAILSVI